MIIRDVMAINQVGKNAVEATFRLEGDDSALQEAWDGMKNGKKYELTIKEIRKHRSLSANAYAWVLMQKMAEELGITKEEVYRQNVQSYGTFSCIIMRDDAVDSFRKMWESNGLGWQIEILDGTFGFTDVLAYPGTSTYDSKQMGRFIDGLVQDCKDLGIETLPPDQLAAMIKEWEK